MHLFFGRKKKPTLTREQTANDAIWKLQQTLEMIEKREKHLEKKVQQELAVARANAQKDKRMAMFALKKKRVYETQIEKLAGAQMTITNQILQLEQATITRDTMSVMQQGADAMKTIYGDMSVDKVDDIMEDIRESAETGNEIMDAISQPANFGFSLDDDELLAELEEIQQQEVDSKILDSQTVVTVPSVVVPNAIAGQPGLVTPFQPPQVPSTQPPVQPSQDDSEETLRRLANEMNV